MLVIAASFSGVKLVAAPTAVTTLTAGLSDTDPVITFGRLVIEWGDNSVTDTGPVPLPLTATAYPHSYSQGDYVVVVKAYNYRQPVPDTALYQQELTVTLANQPAAQTSAVVFGPILPRSSGYPGPDDWSFNMATDGVILESSLTMLLLTRRGERVMDPGYGTNLAGLIFNPVSDNVNAAVQEEVVRAVGLYEPRATLVGINTSVLGQQAFVTAEFRSRLSGAPVLLNLGFST